MKIAKAIFLDKDNKEHILYYRLYDTDLVDRWINITRKNQVSSKELSYKFTNRTYRDLPEVTDNFNELVAKINALYDKELPQYAELDTHKLNHLHEEFEIYGSRVEEFVKANNFKEELHQLFLRLNEAIHLVEDVLKTRQRPWPSFAMLYDYIPQEHHSPILPEDMFWLRSGLQWGKIYLGYNTLGKDWLKIQSDNDIEVIERDMVQTQKRFAAETWINFGPDQDHNFNLVKFYYWWKTLPEHLQKKVPIYDPEELALGRFVLGELIIDDYFLNFHNNLDDWMLPRHPCKLEWNLKVFSTFRELKDVIIIRE
jgi:hypothetical protein